nr:hypothetical protein [Tanacetum cinerariifolium]
WAYLSTHPSKRLHSFCYDDDDEDYTSAITPNEPVLSTEEPDNSLSMGDEHLDTIPATKSDEVIKSSVENLIPVPSESEGIPEHMRDVPFHDNSSPFDVLKGQIKDFSESNDEVSSTDDDSFSIDEIDYVEASPPDYELVSSEVMEIVIPKVGGIDDDIILTIKDDILREKLSDFYEFSDELIPFISSPEYDCFLFKVEPNSRDFTKDVVEDISPTKEPQVHNALPTHPTLQLNMKFQPSSESVFMYVVWIFFPFFVYSVAPHDLLSLRNEDTIFDLGIYNSYFSRPDVSHRCGTVMKFNTHRSQLNECPMLINGKNTPILDVPFFHFYPS